MHDVTYMIRLFCRKVEKVPLSLLCVLLLVYQNCMLAGRNRDENKQQFFHTKPCKNVKQSVREQALTGHRGSKTIDGLFPTLWGSINCIL